MVIIEGDHHALLGYIRCPFKAGGNFRSQMIRVDDVIEYSNVGN